MVVGLAPGVGIGVAIAGTGYAANAAHAQQRRAHGGARVACRHHRRSPAVPHRLSRPDE